MRRWLKLEVEVELEVELEQELEVELELELEVELELELHVELDLPSDKICTLCFKDCNLCLPAASRFFLRLFLIAAMLPFLCRIFRDSGSGQSCTTLSD